MLHVNQQNPAKYDNDLRRSHSNRRTVVILKEQNIVLNIDHHGKNQVETYQVNYQKMNFYVLIATTL